MFNKKLTHVVVIMSFINLLLYHFPFYKFIASSVDLTSLNGILLLVSLTIMALILNAFVFYIGLYLLRSVGKYILMLFFIINAVSVYFINTYGVILDRTMIGNIINTNFEESSSFISVSLFLYLIFLGLLPSIFIYKLKIVYVTFKKFAKHTVLTLIFLLLFIYANATNWLWIDKNSTKLGAIVMPWSYVVNTCRFYHKKNQKNKKQERLPNALVKNDEKSVMVLVIGESARSKNFSLYGYEKQTNPILANVENLRSYKATSCATYTTAGVKCILSHTHSSKLYEILPNYLFRSDTEVIWRTTNWGEPTVKINTYQGRKELSKFKVDGLNKYDEVLLNGLKEQIANSKKNKVLVILHASTSHGPTYYKKYPAKFNKFTPVCESVELAKCTQEELINAYDNTILYTDYILGALINQLKELTTFDSSMIFISDHGESLGENNLYMHGIPLSIAPKEQYEIPFIVWTSDKAKKCIADKELSQHYIFHSVLDFLDIESPVYDKKMSVFVD